MTMMMLTMITIKIMMMVVVAVVVEVDRGNTAVEIFLVRGSEVSKLGFSHFSE